MTFCGLLFERSAGLHHSHAANCFTALMRTTVETIATSSGDRHRREIPSPPWYQAGLAVTVKFSPATTGKAAPFELVLEGFALNLEDLQSASATASFERL